MNNNSLQEKYQQEIRKKLIEDFKLKNPMEVPKLNKIVINVGIGDVIQDKQAVLKAKNTLASLAGQQPVARLAKKAIAEFKIRKGITVGFQVTLRKKKMYQFLERLTKIVLPRVRDFQGVSRNSFDKQGNYTLGLREQIIFPEVDYDKIDRVRGLEISFVINRPKEQSLKLLEYLGVPFTRS